MLPLLSRQDRKFTKLLWILKFATTDYLSVMTKALGDRFAEAFAESLHSNARESWGFGHTENLTKEGLIREKYRGIRPAPGYPAQPDHTEKSILWQVLDVERRAEIELTESLGMYPGSSVSGLYFAHPEAKSSGGKIERDQVEDYAARKGMSVSEIERWFSRFLLPHRTGRRRRHRERPSNQYQPLTHRKGGDRQLRESH